MTETKVFDPIEWAKLNWPHVTFYKEQKDIIYSVRDNDETFVPAGNMLGKDFISAFIVLWFFCSRTPCRIITTSVDYEQLKGVLWGEIRRFLQTSKYVLPVVANHLELKRQDLKTGEVEGLSYLIGRVAAKGEGMLGHHIAKTGDGVPRTLFVADEASGIEDESYDKADTWANRKLVIGNPYPCTNFFYNGVKGGDLESPEPGRLYRKIIKIKAQDSPNVKLGEIQVAKNETPTNEIIIPGVKSYDEYMKNRKLWDSIKQCVSLDAEFYEGAEVLMYPPEWLNKAEQTAALLPQRRPAKVIGLDVAEGGDNTCWCMVDDQGLIHMVSKRTPDTSLIVSETIALMQEWNVKPEKVLLDRGGGGKQIADMLRRQGFKVRTVGFGESVMPEKRRGQASVEKRKEFDEDRYVYLNRRAEMYGMIRNKLDPVFTEGGFGIPQKYCKPLGDGRKCLREQLGVIPLTFDSEGRMYLLPKTLKPTESKNSEKQTLVKIIGHSPDEADALALAVFGLYSKKASFTVR